MTNEMVKDLSSKEGKECQKVMANITARVADGTTIGPIQ
jgi:hypothetical protein